MTQVKKSLKPKSAKKNIHHDIMVEAKGKELNITIKEKSNNQYEFDY